MKLSYRVNLAGLGLVTAIALGMGLAAVLTIDRLSLNLNHQILASELAISTEHVSEARAILKESNLLTVQAYVDRAKTDLMRMFRAEAGERFGRLTIFSPQGEPVFHARNQPSTATLPEAEVKDLMRRGAGVTELFWNGKLRMAHFQGLPEWGWLLMVSLPLQELEETRNMFMAQAMIIFGVLSLLGWALFVRLSRSVVMPVQRLARASAGIAKGDWTLIPPPTDRDDELGELESSFRDMAENLRMAGTELEHRAQSLHETNARLTAEIRERGKAEADLQKTSDALETILDSMPSMVIGVDAECRVTHWNQNAEDSTGIARGQALGQALDQALPRLAGHMETVREAMRQGLPQRLGKQPFEQNGRILFEDVLVFPLRGKSSQGAVIRLDDVTKRVRMDELMVQTEKMMSVGGLAAGMAHEINNPLGGILQGAQNIKRRLLEDIPGNVQAAGNLGCRMDTIRDYMRERDIPKLLDGIVDSGRRAADIIANMLDFSRKSESQLTASDLNAVLDNALQLAANDYDLKKEYDFKKINIVRCYGEALPRVPCSPTELEQVFLNLLTNAAHALAENNTGQSERSIVLRTRSDRKAVIVEIEDNGPGMDEETRKKIFEPFFTTKEPGTGTGLGLSVSYFIITQNHGGDISVQSAPGEGARFTIRLPLERPGNLQS
ncbi:ATP-binding protein [Desulfocurvus sp. DL9XJH121]